MAYSSSIFVCGVFACQKRKWQHLKRHSNSIRHYQLLKIFQSMITFTTRDTWVLRRLYLAYLIHGVLEQIIFWSLHQLILEKLCIVSNKTTCRIFQAPSNYCIPSMLIQKTIQRFLPSVRNHSAQTKDHGKYHTIVVTWKIKTRWVWDTFPSGTPPGTPFCMNYNILATVWAD